MPSLLQVLFFAFSSVWGSPGSVITIGINELQIAPSGGASEFIELYNDGPDVIRLDQLMISDARNLDGILSALSTSVLQPGEYLVLVPDTARFDGQGVGQIAEVSPWPSLNNGGDQISVRLAGSIVDSLSYSAASYERSRSLERIDPAIPGFLSENWSPSIDPAGATPGYVNSVFRPDTESPGLEAAAYRTPELIELFYSESVPPSNRNLARILVDGLRIQESALSVSGSTMSIRSASDAAIAYVSGVVDWAGNEISPTSLHIAQRPLPGDLRINEIMYDPASSLSNNPEYIELINRTDHPVALTGVRLLTRAPGFMTTRTFSLGPNAHLLPSYGLAVLYSEPLKEPNGQPDHESSLERAYPLSPTSDVPVVLVPNAGTSLGLVNSGMDVWLESGEPGPTARDTDVTTVIDSLKYSPAWHDRRWLTTRGRSLALISGCLSKKLALCWTSTTTLSGATPGLPYRGDPPGATAKNRSIVINEIMSDPIAEKTDSRPDQTEFIEIANVSGKPVDINGVYLLRERDEELQPDSIRLVYRPTTLVTGELAVIAYIPSNISDTIDAPEVFLRTGFRSSSSDSIVIPLRVRLNLPSDGALLRLMTPTGDLLDELFYRRSWHHPSIASAKGVSLERIDLRSSSTSQDNWTTSIAAGGATPGSTNSVALNTIDFNITDSSSPSGWFVSPETISPDNDGQSDRMKISLPGHVSSFRSVITIYDLAGRSVKELFPLPGDTMNFIWDGTGFDGRRLPPGFYILFTRPRADTAQPGLKKAVGLIW